MSKDLSMITLGRILDEILKEGEKKGENWNVPRLYITRNEQSPKNIQLTLTRLQKKHPEMTEEDAIEHLLFPYYKSRESGWRTYSREQADKMKEKIKEVRGYK